MNKPKKLKITVEEFTKFSNSLSYDWYFDYETGTLPPEDIESLPPTNILTIEEGTILIVWQGTGIAPPNGEPDQKEFITEFLKWKHLQGNRVCLISIKNEDFDKIKKLLGDNGVKVEETGESLCGT